MNSSTDLFSKLVAVFFYDILNDVVVKILAPMGLLVVQFLPLLNNFTLMIHSSKLLYFDWMRVVQFTGIPSGVLG